jgi:hypothetical protein
MQLLGERGGLEGLLAPETVLIGIRLQSYLHYYSS